MKKRLLILLFVPLLMGAATITWDPVTTDITGAPDIADHYTVYTRDVGTTQSWSVVGITITTELPLPTPAAKKEYAVTASDIAGNESDFSVIVTAKPDTPQGPKVDRTPSP